MHPRPLRLALLLTLAPLLSLAPEAQEGARALDAAEHLRPLESPARTATLRLADGTRQGGSTLAAGGVALAPAFVNTDTSGFFASFSTGSQWMDWGLVTGDTGSDIVGSFTFGYGTTATDVSQGGRGANLALRFYDGIVGLCADSGAIPTASFSMTGLPAASGGGAGATWILTVDLTGGLEFCLPGEGQAFGYGFSDLDFDGSIGLTGPILCYAGDGLDPTSEPDANGQIDIFDIWEPEVTSGFCVGSFFFGGRPNNFSSWYLQLDTVDAGNSSPAATAVRNTTNPDVYRAASDPVLGQTYTGTVSSSCGGTGVFLVASFDSGVRTTPFGDILLGSGPYFESAFAPFTSGVANVSLRIPKDLSRAGTSASTQTLEIGCGSFELHNAVDLTLGF